MSHVATICRIATWDTSPPTNALQKYDIFLTRQNIYRIISTSKTSRSLTAGWHGACPYIGKYRLQVTMLSGKVIIHARL